jgi:hypothetical protein
MSIPAENQVYHSECPGKTWSYIINRSGERGFDADFRLPSAANAMGSSRSLRVPTIDLCAAIQHQVGIKVANSGKPLDQSPSPACKSV